MKCISIVNAKGGVAKTTSALCLASYLSQKGKRVIVVDLDPQANASKSLLKIPVGYDAEPPTLFDALYSHLMEKKKNIIQTTLRYPYENLAIIPASPRMEAFKDMVKSQARRPLEVLKAVFKPLYDSFDFMIIDCPADLSIYVENALEISDLVICPSTYDMFGLDGISKVVSVIMDIKGEDFLGFYVLYTMFNAQATRIQEDLGELAQELEEAERVLPFRVPVDQGVRNAQAKFEDLIRSPHFKNSRARIAYQNLGEFVLTAGESA